MELGAICPADVVALHHEAGVPPATVTPAVSQVAVGLQDEKIPGPGLRVEGADRGLVGGALPRDHFAVLEVVFRSSRPFGGNGAESRGLADHVLARVGK